MKALFCLVVDAWKPSSKVSASVSSMAYIMASFLGAIQMPLSSFTSKQRSSGLKETASGSSEDCWISYLAWSGPGPGWRVRWLWRELYRKVLPPAKKRGNLLRRTTKTRTLHWPSQSWTVGPVLTCQNQAYKIQMFQSHWWTRHKRAVI